MQTEKNEIIYDRLNSVHKINNFLFNQFRFPGSRKFGRLISKSFLPRLDSTIQCPTIHGFDMILDEDGGRNLYYLGFYELGTLHVIKNSLLPGDVFVDAGASIGLMSVFASKLVGENGKVFSFEPAKNRFEKLQKNILINQCKNVTINNLGLGAEEKVMDLFYSGQSPSVVNHMANVKKEQVKIVKIDQYLKSQSLDEAKLIKIDVEGYEYDVLQGASDLLSSDSAPIICVEYISEFQSNRSNSLLEYLKDINDYEFYKLQKTSSTKSKLIKIKNSRQFPDQDNLYCMTERRKSELPNQLFV